MYVLQSTLTQTAGPPTVIKSHFTTSLSVFFCCLVYCSNIIQLPVLVHGIFAYYGFACLSSFSIYKKR